MKPIIFFSKLAAYSSLSLIIVGCATTANPELESTQRIFDQLKSDPNVMTKAPVAFAEAEESLNDLKMQVANDEGDEVIKRLAYETELKVKIAREKANTALAKELVAKAEAERKQILIEARTEEADEARARAEKALGEAEEARKKAEELAKQLADLQAKKTDRGMVLTMDDVLFDYNKADVKEGGMRVVEQLTDFLNKYPERNIQIEGHTDSTGSDSYNLSLSERRAEAVKRALIYKGIAANRITAIGYGEQFPVASNETPAGRQQNRRVEIVISDENGKIIKR